MTTNPSNGGNRRHRGRRGRRSGNRGNPQPSPQIQDGGQPELPEGGASLVAEAAAVIEEVAARPAPPRPDQRPRPAEHQGERPRGAHGDPRNGRGPARRRPQPRQPAGPMPMEVLKRHVRVGDPEYALQMRPVEGLIHGDEAANFGCPMLQRNMTRMPATGNQLAARCSLGWSIRDEHEAHFCMHTPDLLECWKAHPERMPELEERVRAERDNPQAAD